MYLERTGIYDGEKMDLVSVVLTTHNRLELLKRAVKSVWEQTYSNIELIVVDDASDDGTFQWSKNQKFIYHYISRKESKGGNYARNLGIKATKGKYIAFLDDDDYWQSEKIYKQVELIKSKECGLVYCGRQFENVLVDSVAYSFSKIDPDNQGDVSKRIFSSIICSTSTIMVEKELLFKAGLFDENLSYWQEYELNIRLAQMTHFYYIDEPLCVYRIDKRDKNRLTNKYFDWKKAVNYIEMKHKKKIDGLSFYDKMQRRLMILWDAQNRCKASHLYFHYIAIYIEWFILALPFRVINKMKRVLRRTDGRYAS